MYVHVCMCIYIYIERERDIHTHTHTYIHNNHVTNDTIHNITTAKRVPKCNMLSFSSLIAHYTVCTIDGYKVLSIVMYIYIYIYIVLSHVGWLGRALTLQYLRP